MGSVSMGWLARAEGDLSYAMGSLVQATADCSMVLGRGDAVHGDLINNIESSLVIGFDSTTPTFYVDGSSVGVGTTSPVTTLDINGGLATNIGPQVSNYTSSAADHTILVDASLGGAVTVTLRPAANAQGQILVIKKIDSSGSGVTVDANGAETIDGSLSYTISSQWDTVTIQSDGSNWYILSKIT